MCTARRQRPSARGSSEIASSWSRAVSGSTVTVVQSRKSVRPRRSSSRTACGTRAASASTSGGNASGSPYFAMTTLRSTPGSSRRPRTWTTPPVGLRVGGGGRPHALRSARPPGRAPPPPPGGDDGLRPHPPVERHDVAAEASVALVAPHQALQPPLEDADDAALGALGRRALEPRHHPIA